MRVLGLALPLLALGCRAGAPGAAPAVPEVLRVRPYQLHVPAGYSPRRAAPLLVSLHGYGDHGRGLVDHLGLVALAEERTLLLAYPDGTPDSAGRRFWNAGDACCNFDRLAVDDVSYLDALIDDVKARFSVDAGRVFLLGLSNGGFMAHRYACVRGKRVAGLISLAGAAPPRADCAPQEAVAVLQIHSDVDPVVRYQGGVLGGGLPAGAPYPSARESVSAWARADGCTGEPERSPHPLDIDSAVPGAETIVEKWPGCARGAAELWTARGGGHVIRPTQAFLPALSGFLEARARPP
ncbi:MAG: hypothetical protein HYZ28_02225 [Myxococcales bacterium]|nr:hypothetical protein [Myxococcales bacterium]